jgi:hypothetical protein
MPTSENPVERKSNFGECAADARQQKRQKVGAAS